MTEAFCVVFARCRKEAGLTLQGLADKAGLTQATVWNYEKGNWLPPVDKMETLCDAMGLTMGQFWKRYDQQKAAG